MVDKYIEQAPGGEITAPDGSEQAPVTKSGQDYFVKIQNWIARKLRETGGPTTLSMGAVADGEFLMRSGSDIIGVAPLFNYVITPSVSSNNLTVALKTLAATDPSSSDPVSFKIGDSWVTITSALSTTKNAATNWCSAGSAEMAANDIDYFVYLINETGASAGVKIAFSRIPYAVMMSDFVNTSTDEKYIAGNWTNFNATDKVQNIGRFRAQLSAAAGHNWSIPTARVINYPIYETDMLSWSPQLTNITLGSGSITRKIYQVRGTNVRSWIRIALGAGGSLTGSATFTVPFNTYCGGSFVIIGQATYHDALATVYHGVFMTSGTNNVIQPHVFGSAGTYATYGSINGTIPMTWTDSDEIIGYMEWELVV